MALFKQKEEAQYEKNTRFARQPQGKQWEVFDPNALLCTHSRKTAFINSFINALLLTLVFEMFLGMILLQTREIFRPSLLEFIIFILLLTIFITAAAYLYFRNKTSEFLFFGNSKVYFQKKGRIQWQCYYNEIEEAGFEYLPGRHSSTRNYAEPCITLKTGERLRIPKGRYITNRTDRLIEETGQFLPFQLLQEKGITVKPDRSIRMPKGWSSGLIPFIIFILLASFFMFTFILYLLFFRN